MKEEILEKIKAEAQLLYPGDDQYDKQVNTIARFERFAFLKGGQLALELAGNGWISEVDKARFWIKVSQTKYCWLWTGSVNNKGYGTFRMPGGSFLAPRLAYKLINGNIPEGLEVCHKCDNPLCVNPDHLFCGTHQDNMTDMKLKGRARRIQGSSSKYIGVGFRSDSKKWRGYVSFKPNQVKFLKSCNTELEAAQIRDAYILENGLIMTEALNFSQPLPSPPSNK